MNDTLKDILIFFLFIFSPLIIVLIGGLIFFGVDFLYLLVRFYPLYSILFASGTAILCLFIYWAFFKKSVRRETIDFPSFLVYPDGSRKKIK